MEKGMGMASDSLGRQQLVRINFFFLLSDNTCTSDVFNQYGISPGSEKGATGGTRIKGPGVFDEPGVAQMGGRTPYRLAEVCGNLRDVEEVRTKRKCTTSLKKVNKKC